MSKNIQMMFRKHLDTNYTTDLLWVFYIKFDFTNKTVSYYLHVYLCLIILVPAFVSFRATMLKFKKLQQRLYFVFVNRREVTDLNAKQSYLT